MESESSSRKGKAAQINHHKGRKVWKSTPSNISIIILPTDKVAVVIAKLECSKELASLFGDGKYNKVKKGFDPKNATEPITDPKKRTRTTLD